MSALELKPCLFCGTSLEDDSHPGSTVEGGGFTFECGKCGANWPRMTRETMSGLDDEGIASFFNSRSDLPPGYVILSPDEVRGMEHGMGGRRCVTYVLRNFIGRRRCSTAWLRAQLRRMEADGYVALSERQDRGGMINWDVTQSGRSLIGTMEQTNA